MEHSTTPDWIPYWMIIATDVSVIGGFGGVFICTVLLNILHLILPRRFDPHLLNPEHFEPAFRAIVTVGGWPMSLLRTQAYALFVMMPTRVPRFRSVAGDPRFTVSPWVRSLCVAHFVVLAITGVSFLGMFFCWGVLEFMKSKQ